MKFDQTGVLRQEAEKHDKFLPTSIIKLYDLEGLLSRLYEQCLNRNYPDETASTTLKACIYNLVDCLTIPQ